MVKTNNLMGIRLYLFTNDLNANLAARCISFIIIKRKMFKNYLGVSKSFLLAFRL
jgi:hypothetical protein